MLVKEPVIDAPSHAKGHSSYETECRKALQPHLDAIIDLAVKAGWDRNVASYSMMYLAAKAPKEDASSS